MVNARSTPPAGPEAENAALPADAQARPKGQAGRCTRWQSSSGCNTRGGAVVEGGGRTLCDRVLHVAFRVGEALLLLMLFLLPAQLGLLLHPAQTLGGPAIRLVEGALQLPNVLVGLHRRQQVWVPGQVLASQTCAGGSGGGFTLSLAVCV